MSDDRAQNMRHLTKANRCRRDRSAIKRSIAAGRTDIARVVFDPPWCMRTIILKELLRSQRRWGPVRVRRLCLAVDLDEHKQLGTLTPRQRELLAGVLKQRNGNWSGLT